jgi:AraC-like DNA-binding protein
LNFNLYLVKNTSRLMQRKKLKNLLPPLAFGGRSAKIDDSTIEMLNRILPIVPGLKEYESIAKQGAFQHQSSFLNVNGMKMVATASTPIREKLDKNESTTLIIPFSGQGELLIEGRTHCWEAGVNAVLLPKCMGNGESSLRSLLIIDIDPQKLDLISSGMLGIESNSRYTPDLIGPKTLKLQLGRLSFESIFRQLANLLDQFSLQPELLNRTELDENIYRNLAVMLQPELFLDKASLTPNRKYGRRLLDRVCDYIQSHLGQPISITTLERVSNMSARNLHYGFLKRYNTTPMRWVRAERLAMAHGHLISATPGDTVTSIALACGFSKPAAFADYYQKQYGELPSITLARALAR